MTKPNSNGIPMVDEWIPEKDDMYFTSAKDVVAAPVASYYKMNDASDPITNRINFFWIKPEKFAHWAIMRYFLSSIYPFYLYF